MNLSTPLSELTYTAFDTETTGAYPLDSEICEIAAVKWRYGQVVDTFQTLVKPQQVISDFIIGIHGITNEMVANSPAITDVIANFHRFISDSVLIAHHAPFDLGFVAYEFEKKSLSLPTLPALCSSLLTRKIFPESPNHKLQTLIDFFGIEKGTAHRALDDSKACLKVFLKIAEKVGWDKTFEDILKIQVTRLEWKNFSLYSLQDTSIGHALVSSIENKRDLELSYRTSSDHRVVKPIGVVRNPQGDYLVALQPPEIQQKRFYLTRIVAARTI